MSGTYARVGGPLVMLVGAWSHWPIVMALGLFVWIVSCLPGDDEWVEVEVDDDE